MPKKRNKAKLSREEKKANKEWTKTRLRRARTARREMCGCVYAPHPTKCKCTFCIKCGCIQNTFHMDDKKYNKKRRQFRAALLLSSVSYYTTNPAAFSCSTSSHDSDPILPTTIGTSSSTRTLYISSIYIKENATCLSLYVSKPNQNAFFGRFRIASDAIRLWVSVLDMHLQAISHKQ
jgi:hypothetical protein